MDLILPSDADWLPLLLADDLAGRTDDQAAHLVAARFLAGYTGNTRAGYRRDLRAYFEWCAEHNVSVLTARRATIDVYVHHLASPQTHSPSVAPLEPPKEGRDTARGLRAATIARHLAAISGFYKYAVDENLISRNPVTGVRRPRVGQDSPRLGLDRRESMDLITAAAAESARAHALITLLTLTGLRISEALGADASDLDQIRGHRILLVTRKGGARRQIALSAPVVQAIEGYLDGRTTGPLFQTRTGGRYDRAEAWRLVRRLAHDAGLPNATRLSPHSLRHTFVTLAREAGVPLEDVQDAAGHADPRTTRRYDRGRHNLDRNPTYALATMLARD